MTSFLVPYLLIVLNHLNTNLLPMNEFALPKTWTKDFTIRYTFSGSMDGSRTELTFSYDSCNYTIKPGMKSPKSGVFAMTEADRIEILQKMHALKMDKIKSEIQIAVVNDGWSELLCLGSHCIEGGTSVKMSDKDKEIFSVACGYLQDFVGKKKK